MTSRCLGNSVSATNHGTGGVMLRNGGVAFFSVWADKLRGRPTAAPGFGWEAVATEVDEQVELIEDRRP